MINRNGRRCWICREEPPWYWCLLRCKTWMVFNHIIVSLLVDRSPNNWNHFTRYYLQWLVWTLPSLHNASSCVMDFIISSEARQAKQGPKCKSLNRCRKSGLHAGANIETVFKVQIGFFSIFARNVPGRKALAESRGSHFLNHHYSCYLSYSGHMFPKCGLCCILPPKVVWEWYFFVILDKFYFSRIYDSPFSLVPFPVRSPLGFRLRVYCSFLMCREMDQQTASPIMIT